MALTQVVFGEVGDMGAGGMLPALIASSISSETIAPTGSNQMTTAVAPALGRRPCARVATDTAVYVAIGASPDASTAANRIYLPANAVEYIMCKAGDKLAVITA